MLGVPLRRLYPALMTFAASRRSAASTLAGSMTWRGWSGGRPLRTKSVSILSCGKGIVLPNCF